MMTYFERISTIGTACEIFGIPYTINTILDGYQIRFPWCDGDIACHSYTFGVSNDCVESYCFPWDEDDVTVLEVEEAINKIIDLYFS